MSYQKPTRLRRFLSVLMALTLLVSTYAFVLPVTTEAIGAGDFVYGHYYYYPAGTQFVKGMYIGTHKLGIFGGGSGDAKDNARAGGAYPNVIDKDLNDGARGHYVFLAYSTTGNINEAVTYLRNTHSIGSLASTTAFSVGGVNPTFHVVGGNESNDLNKGASGDYIYLYYTADPRAGLPITALAINTSSSQSGYQTVLRDNTGSASDCNAGAGGDYIYIHFDNTSVYTDVTTQVNNLKTALDKAGSLTASNYTSASWNTLQNAVNTGNAIWNAYNNSFHAASRTASEITNATNAINNALNALQTTITLNAAQNGGTCSTTSVNITCGTNTTVTFPAGSYTASKNGWEFLGWNTSASATTGTKGNLSLPLKATVYAIFRTSVSGTFHYMNANGSDAAYTATNYVYNNGSSAAVTAPGSSTAVKNGKTYTFAGWADQANATTANLSSFSLTVGSPRDFYAVYTTPVSLIYDANNGTNAPAASTVSIGANYNATQTGTASISVTGSVPSRIGYTFAGWADTAGASSAQYQSGSVITGLTADKTLYAVWDLNEYTVTFVVNGVTKKTETVPYGGSATAPAVDAYATIDANNHSVFTGWDRTFSSVTGDLIVHAVFETEAHDYLVSETIPASCEQDGSILSVCADCGQEKIEVLPATGHAWGEWTVVTPATCEGEGAEQRVCANDASHIETRAIAATGHTKETIPAKAATCTETGLTEGVKCAVCGKVLVAQETIPATGHAWGAWTVVTPATCENEGVEQRVCANDASHVETRPIAKLDHTPGEPVRENETAATCSAEGSYDEVVYCTVCGAELSRETKVLEKLPHTEETIAGKAATCTEDGLTDGVKCSVCGEILVAQEIIPATGHDWGDWLTIVLPTCEQEGLERRICKNDPTHIEEKPIPATGHDWGEWTVITPATCEEAGEEQRVCANDASHIETQAIPATGHTEETIPGKAATCTEEGLTDGVKCAVCGKVLVAQETIPATGHDWGEWTVITPATCENEGEEQRVCANDASHVETRPIAKLDHTPGEPVRENETAATCSAEGSYDEVVYCTVCGEELSRETKTIEKLPHTEEAIPGKAATCTETGLTDGVKCSVCGEILVAQEVIPATGHDWGEWTVITPATCEEAGEEQRVCANDASHVETRAIAATGHTEETIPGKAATCTEDGLTDGVKCSVCDEILVAQEIIPATGHTEESIPGKAATCTEDGLTDGIKCAVCGEILVAQEIIPATGHTEETIPGKAATCTEDGLTDGIKCAVCGEILVAQEVIPAKGHTPEIIPGVKPVCGEKDGLTDGEKCSVCGAILKEQTVIQAPAHQRGEWVVVVEPTCLLPGSEVCYCSVCGEKLDERFTWPLGHVDEDGDGFCDRGCGARVEPPEGYTFDTFRCKMCDEYEKNKDVPFVGIIYSIVHFFVHLAHYIGYLT